MTKGTEALERLIGNKVFISLGRTQGKKQFANDIKIIEKELKAIEIIRNKSVYMILLKDTKNVNEYNDKVSFFPRMELTQEEYDLVKEVLL